MKVLLDECIPQPFCRYLTVEHHCETARAAGFGGTKNGELLRLAEEAGFEVLLTVDKGFVHQQNPSWQAHFGYRSASSFKSVGGSSAAHADLSRGAPIDRTRLCRASRLTT